MQYTAGIYKAFADNGTPLSGGRLYTYANGTTTQKNAFTTAALSTPCTYTSDGLGGQYIALNSRGEATLWLNIDALYTMVVKTSSGATLITANDQGAIGSISSAMAPVVSAATLSAARTALGASSSGDTVFTGTAAQGRTALGSTTVGDAVFIAASASAARTALGAADDAAVVHLTGAETVAGVKTFSSQPVLPNAPVMSNQATTSGSNVDVTTIPSWARIITITLDGVSTNGTNAMQVQIGSGSFTTSGYTSVTNGAFTGNSWNAATFTTGFGLQNSNLAANINHAQVTIINTTGNTWVYNSTLSASVSQGAGMIGGGSITLGGVLDRVRFTCGGDTFDAGSVNIRYEA